MHNASDIKWSEPCIASLSTAEILEANQLLREPLAFLVVICLRPSRSDINRVQNLKCPRQACAFADAIIQTHKGSLMLSPGPQPAAELAMLPQIQQHAGRAF